jgi:hypothetical protein
MNFPSLILVTNGCYDMMCSICMVMEWGPLARLHTSLFEISPSSDAVRFLAYWVLTYGAVRFACGLYPTEFAILLGAHTYALEAIFIELELTVGNHFKSFRSHVVAAMCTALALFLFTWTRLAHSA